MKVTWRHHPLLSRLFIIFKNLNKHPGSFRHNIFELSSSRLVKSCPFLKLDVVIDVTSDEEVPTAKESINFITFVRLFINV